MELQRRLLRLGWRGGCGEVRHIRVANAELFAKRFKELGGKITMEKRETYGHHPHGLEVGKQQRFVDFFNGK